MLQTLNLLSGFDLKAMGLGSADTLHTFTEAMKLAFDDRDVFYGDPDFSKVPGEAPPGHGLRERAAQADRSEAGVGHASARIPRRGERRRPADRRAWPAWTPPQGTRETRPRSTPSMPRATCSRR